MTDDTIHNLSCTVRELVFDPLVEHLYLGSTGRVFQVACCLDTLEDAQLAVDEYRTLQLSADPAEDSKGKLYLAVYGVLQATFLQQDALMNLANALNLPLDMNDYPTLKEAREIRNQIAGHPTSYTRNKIESYHPIMRPSLSLDNIEVLATNERGLHKKRSVDIKQMLSENENSLREALKALISKVRSDMRNHKANFRDNPLSRLFPDSLGYLCQKVRSGTLNPSENDRILAVAAVETIEGLLGDLDKAVSDRGKNPGTYPSLDLVWNELQYPIKELRTYFANDDEEINAHKPEAAGIFAWYVKSKLYALREICHEIDEYYDSDEST